MRNYPFAAVVGQERLKTAYLANIVNPGIGGLLILGAKGTGKSTVVRSVQPILPRYHANADCPFSCDPAHPEKWCSFCRKSKPDGSVSRSMRIVNLPLSCTEDRLIGSIEIETLLKEGRKDIVVGILGEANRNILYIDEVNLLPDHIVDDILDAAASHWNRIEREGFSLSHPSEFVLVGSMNPEEGDLRPQILDRFPLSVKVGSIRDPVLRVELIKRNLLFEGDPEGFSRMFEPESELLRNTVVQAGEILPNVSIREIFLSAVASACVELKVDGQRPDIIIVKTSRTLAALENRTDVEESDILLAAVLSLGHRTRNGGLLEPPEEDDIVSVFTSLLQKQTRLEPKTVSGKSFTTVSGIVDKSIGGFFKLEDLKSKQVKKN